MRLPGAIRRSVRRKTIAVILATAGVALLVHSLLLLAYEARAYRAALIADLRTQAEILGQAAEAAIAFNDRKAAAEDLAMLKARPDIEAAAFYLPDGALFASYSRTPEAEVPAGGQPPGQRVDADEITMVVPVVREGRTVSTVYLRARSGLEARIIDYLGIAGLVMAIALAVAWLLSAWLQRAVTGPILAVAAAARRVFEGRDLSVRAEKTSEDEVGMLAEALNRMLADLEREMAERRGAEEALKRADRRKDEFLAMLAHELRNPLAPIINALYLLKSPRRTEEMAAEARAIIERQLEQMIRLVDDLLDVSRITTGKLALRRERVELRSIAQNAVETVRPLVEARRHTLIAELPPAGVRVNADPARLAQVFFNLLNNAAKFTDPGGRIEFRVGVEDREMVARVRDNGAGIAPEMREEIFEMFAQADRSLERSTLGLGVGLSLSRRLVELHGGTIEAQSAGPGQGSEFIVRMPVASVGASDAAQDGGAATQKEAGVRRRILLADDNVDFATSLASVLRSLGNEVHVEHDGAAALAAAQRLRPDVAFLDIGLPKLSGYDLARSLRRLPETADSILVAVTGMGQPSDRVQAKEAGFDEHLVKPVAIERIEAILRGA